MSDFGEWIHFIGVGGIGMSALARWGLSKGYLISGSDRTAGEEFVKLAEEGAEVWMGECPERMKGASVVVRSAAVPDENTELVYAREQGVPTYERGEFLGRVARDYGGVIAIAGTHGKTTVTAMLSEILEESGFAFGAAIGGNLKNKGNFIAHGEDWFLCEACEYRRSFLHLTPHLTLLTSAEFDHPDCYRNEEELFATFDAFLENSAPSAYLVLPSAFPRFSPARFPYRRAITFGYGEADVAIRKEREWKRGYFGCSIVQNGYPNLEIDLIIPGKYNLLNAAGAIGAARLVGAREEAIKRALTRFEGVERRFEILGYAEGAKVIRDYAHHPSELKAALAAAHAIATGEVYLVFQPHTYSRTAALFEAFVSVLEGEDHCYLFREYAARETPEAGKSALELYRALSGGGDKGYFDDMSTLGKHLLRRVGEGDVVLVAGAGNIEILGRILATEGEEG